MLLIKQLETWKVGRMNAYEEQTAQTRRFGVNGEKQT